MSTVESGSTVVPVGIHLAGAPPVGRLQLPLDRGLTALYGKNGVGKSRLLAEIALALEPLTLPRVGYFDDEGEPRERVPDHSRLPRALDVAYLRPGLHLHCPCNGQIDSDVLVAVLSEATHAGFASGEVDFVGPIATWDDVLEYVADRLPFDASLDDADYLLESGRWIATGSEFGPLSLCDPDPVGGPLRRHWEVASARWQEAARSSRDAERATLVYEHEVWNGPFRWTCSLITNRSRHEPVLPGLPPFPEHLGVDPFPDWFALPVAAVSFLHSNSAGFALIREKAGADISADTAAALPYRWKRRRSATNASLAGLTTRDGLLEVERRANHTLATMFDEPPFLRARLSDPSEWMKGRPAVRWSASTEDKGPEFAFDALGSAHHRYATLAIQRALSSALADGLARSDAHGARSPDARHEISFVLIDEPETALNPAAEQQVAHGLRHMGTHVIVATHSALIVDNADRIDHVVRDGSGCLAVRPFVVHLDPEQRRLEARRLGHTPGTLALLVRVVLLVEGPMDEAVVSAFVAPEIERSRTMVLPLMGTRDVPSLPNASYLFNSTDAPVLVCLDNIDATGIDELRTAVAHERDPGRQRSILAQAKKRYQGDRRPEMAKLVELLGAAVAAHRMDRIHVFGLERRDILEYLPVDLFRPGATSWAEVAEEFKRREGREFKAGDGEKYKRFVGKNCTVRGVRHALDRLRLDAGPEGDLVKRRHEEFAALGERLLRLAQRSATTG